MSNQTPTALEKWFQLVVQPPSGTALPQRPIIQFTGVTPTDDPVNNRTIVPLGGGGGGVLTAYGADLANSAPTLQYVSGISFDSTGLAGAGGAVAVRGTATSLNWLNNAVTIARGGTTLISLAQVSADFIKIGIGGSIAANATAGAIVVNTGASGARTLVTCAGAQRCALGEQASGIGGLWLGPGAPIGTNYSVAGDGATSYFQGVSSQAFGINGSFVRSNTLTANGFQINASGLNVTSFGGGVGVIGLGNATTVPTTNPTAGGVIFAMPTGSAGSADGTLSHRGQGGMMEQLAGPGTGTINTQLAIKRRVAAFSRLAVSSGVHVTVYTHQMPATAHMVVIEAWAAQTDVTAVTGSIGGRSAAAFYNNGGTITQIGATASEYALGAAVGVASPVFLISGTNILVQLVSNSGDTYDSQTIIEIQEC